jgi:CheY-like chemotaxis protein
VVSDVILNDIESLPRVGEFTSGADMEVGSARKTILVVDDDPDIVDYASRVLEDYGYEVVTAGDGATALSLLRTGEQIDLLFTDVVMPGLDGIEVARRACQEAPGLKVLFTSGYATQSIPEGRLLSKPYRPQQLVGAIAVALGK